MKSVFLLSALLSSAAAMCDPETVIPVTDGLSKLTVTGFESPIINYFSAVAGAVSYFLFVVRQNYFVCKLLTHIAITTLVIFVGNFYRPQRI